MIWTLLLLSGGLPSWSDTQISFGVDEREAFDTISCEEPLAGIKKLFSCRYQFHVVFSCRCIEQWRALTKGQARQTDLAMNQRTGIAELENGLSMSRQVSSFYCHKYLVAR